MSDLHKLNRWQGEQLRQLRTENQQLRKQLARLRAEAIAGNPDLRREIRALCRSWRKRLELAWHKGCGHAVIPDGYEGVMTELQEWGR